jgi:glyoxylase-like metal-dependent hydrolase (beta-lactamase superfamily II)
VKIQAPGFYRMMLGDFEVTVLNDGVVAYMTAQVLPGLTQDQIRSSLFEMGLSDPVGMSYNAILINTAGKLVLIDTGTGGKLNDSPYFGGTGRLLANLRAAGYQPEEVDEVYVTHLGPDHVGGLTLGNERTFPNAILRAAKSEVDVFLGPNKLRQEVDWRVKFWTDLFAPYIKAGKFESFDGDVTLTPGIRALATHGHTPGHTSYVVESKGQALLVLGDVVLLGAMQFAQPELESVFDADRPAAVAERQRLLQLAAERDFWVAGSHISFPGVGHVRAWREGYRWIPANYAIPH